MAIQYVPNAAAISWLALCDALDSRAIMERELFNLFAKNTELSITQTQNQATNTRQNLEAQAQQSFVSGIMGILGAGASVAMTGVSLYKENSYLKQANAPSIEDEVSFNQQPGNSNNINSNNINNSESPTPSTPNSSSRLDNDPNSNSNESARVKGQNAPASSKTVPPANTTEQSQDNQSEANKAEANKARQVEAQNNAQWWAQNSNNFSAMASQVVSGFSNLLQSGYIKTQAKAQAAQNIASGLAAVFNTQSNMISAALGSCDTYMQNVNGTITTIIQVSAVRG